MRVRTAAIAVLLSCFLYGSGAAPSDAAIGQLRLVYDVGRSLHELRATARRYDTFVLQAWDTRGLRAIKRRNPRATVLAYQNLSAMARGPRPARGVTSSGVWFGEAAGGRHPHWFLHTPHGHRIREQGYPWLYMADVGDRGYQRRWARNVAGLLERHPWDGVLLDDVSPTARYHVTPSRIAKYPDDAAYQRAMGSMLAYVAPRIRPHGLVVANMGAWSEYPAVVTRWLRYVDGAMDESFVKWSPQPGLGYRTPAEWRVNLREVRATQRRGKLFLAVTHAQPDDRRAKLLGWGTLLLGADGRAAYSATPSYDAPPGRLSRAALDVGAPVAPARRTGLVWYRRFAHALVVVNPGLAAQPVAFPVPMSGPGHVAASELTIGPQSAVILRRSPFATLASTWPALVRAPVTAR